MTSTASPSEPQLAPPGAGLPGFELFVARLLFSLRCAVTTRKAALAKIVAERHALNAVVQSCDPAVAAERVLIPRPRGLEDSSRHWSVWMTLEHLRLVNEGIAATICALASGRVPPEVVSTADVKPGPAVDGSILKAFDRSCDLLIRAGRDAASLATPERRSHPWFGPLNAAQWQVLGGMHLGMHRRQIKVILATLDGKPIRPAS